MKNCCEKFRVLSRCASESVLQAAADLPCDGPDPGGGGEGRPAGAAQPGGGRTWLLHPERPLSSAGNSGSTPVCLSS